jgi:AcrR family transcriptional regulator
MVIYLGKGLDCADREKVEMSARTEAVTTSGRKRRGEGHTRREEILAAARHLFVAQGFDAVTIRRIAEEVGVSAPALYLYFPDKDAILLEICDATFNDLIALFEDVRRREPPGRKRLAMVGEAFIRFALAHPEEYRLIFMGGAPPPAEIVARGGHRAVIEDPDTPGAKGPMCFKMMIEEYELLARSGVTLPAEPVTCAELCFMSSHGMASLLISKPDFPWSDRETLIKTGVRVTLDGLLGPETAS